jgi:hypothetical protein
MLTYFKGDMDSLMPIKTKQFILISIVLALFMGCVKTNNNIDTSLDLHIEIDKTKIENIFEKEFSNIRTKLWNFEPIDDELNFEEIGNIISAYSELSRSLSALIITNTHNIEDDNTLRNITFHFDTSISGYRMYDNYYEATAIIIFKKYLTDFKNEWSIFLEEQMEKINSIYASRLGNYRKNIYSNMRNDISPNTEILDIVNYIKRQAVISEDIFMYILEECKIKSNSVNIQEIANNKILLDIAPLQIDIIEIDQESYLENTVNMLQGSMQVISNDIITQMKKELSSIVNLRTQDCLDNIEPYLDWYYRYFTSFEKLWSIVKDPFTKEKNDLQLLMVTKYMEFFRSDKEMFDELIESFTKYNSIIQETAFCYVALLEEIHIEYYYPHHTKSEISGQEFIAPYLNAPNYFKNVVDNGLKDIGLSYTDIDGVFALDMANIAINFIPGVKILAGAFVDYFTLKAEEALKRGEYRVTIENKLIENRNKLLNVIQEE